MKKLLASILVALLLMTSTVSAFAAASDGTEPMNIGVNGKYVYTPASGHSESELTDGKYETVLDGIPITVTPEAPQENLRLVVRVIDESHTEAHEWFGDTLADHGDEILPLDIHFVEADGDRVELTSSIDIRVEIPEGFDSPMICYVSNEGQVAVMDATIENGYISWSANRSGYYIFVKRSAPSTPTQPSEPGTSTQPGTPGGPQTGDQNNTTLWMVVLILSGAAIIVLLVIGKRKKD